MQKQKSIKILLLAGDILITQIALFLALWFRNAELLNQFPVFAYHFIFLYALWILVLFLLNLYDVHFLKKPVDFFVSVVIFSFIAIFLSVAYFYFRPEASAAPKTILVLNILVFDILLLGWRYLCNIFLQIQGIKEKVALVGFHKNLKETLPYIKKNYEVSAFFCPPSLNVRPDLLVLEGIHNSADLEDLSHVVQEEKVTSIILALDFYSHADLIKEIFNHLPLTLNYLDFNDLYEFINKKVPLEDINELWFLEKISKSENKTAETFKRLFDILFSLIGMVIFLVSYPLIALAITMNSPGHVFYSQKRVGKAGTIFILRKFRTMREDLGGNLTLWREKNENNITGVGRILRRLHLDELPQCWSILKGDLSFVGPRPEWIELAKIFEKEIPFYQQRYLVKPGIVGWAQINFKPSQSVQEAKEKFQYDLYYIKNRSWLLDLEIILKAIRLFFW